jgi:hypothetical protein
MLSDEIAAIRHTLMTGLAHNPAIAALDRIERAGIGESRREPQPSAQGPAELWLQLHGDCSEIELSEPVDYTSDDVTWCWHQINDSDVRYVRADLAGITKEPQA